MRHSTTLAFATLISLAASGASGCTDASRSSLGSYGDPAEVKCYSGGVMIYNGKSTGKVASTSQSDGWEFRDAASHRFVRVSGDCVVVN